MGFDNILQAARTLTKDSNLAGLEAWKKENPRRLAIGCFPAYVPCEIIHAAGMLPVGLFPEQLRANSSENDPSLQAFPCSVCKNTLSLASQGRLDVLDGVVLSTPCEPVLELESVLTRDFPHLLIRRLQLPDKRGSGTAVDHWETELRRLALDFEKELGTPVADYSLGASIVVYNLWRQRVRELYDQRVRLPHKISAAELYSLVRMGTRLPPEEHILILQDALREVPRRPNRTRPRLGIVLEGAVCEPPPPGLLETLERSGCYILDDDLLIGWRWFFEDVPMTDNPWRSLAESYLERGVVSSVGQPIPRFGVAALLNKVRRSRADAVFFLPGKPCGTEILDVDTYRAALDEAGIPNLEIRVDETMDLDETTRVVRTFINSTLSHPLTPT